MPDSHVYEKQDETRWDDVTQKMMNLAPLRHQPFPGQSFGQPDDRDLSDLKERVEDLAKKVAKLTPLSDMIIVPKLHEIMSILNK